jgi:hypothetical protein
MPERIGPWTLVETQWKPKRQINQGLATVTDPDGSSRLVFRGDNSVSPDLRARGWDHIGDPDSWGGAIVDAYQRSDPAVAGKLFRVTTTDNQVLDFEHALVSTPIAELPNNSFAAISPDGLWLVAGEWFDLDRLLVFPTPTLNSGASQPGQDLKLISVIKLAQPVRNVQGAVFVDDTTLLCSTDDNNPAGKPRLWGGIVRPLLQVTLAAPLPDTSRPATVECVGPIPTPAPGIGTPEVEGIDFDRETEDLRIVVVPAAPVNLLDAAVLRFRQLA